MQKLVHRPYNTVAYSYIGRPFGNMISTCFLVTYKTSALVRQWNNKREALVINLCRVLIQIFALFQSYKQQCFISNGLSCIDHSNVFIGLLVMLWPLLNKRMAVCRQQVQLWRCSLRIPSVSFYLRWTSGAEKWSQRGSAKNCSSLNGHLRLAPKACQSPDTTKQFWSL